MNKRILRGVVGLAFAGIGCTLLTFLWLSPWNEFGSPPLFFRVFGSFIALPFIAIGLGTAFGWRKSDRAARISEPRNPSTAARGSTPSVGYACPNCNSRLGSDADVSPHGDVKCSYCGSWFNVHKATS